MKLFNKTFIESYCNNYFNEFVSDSTMYLKEHNKEYKRLLNKKSKILEQCPKLEKILDDGIKCNLSEYETKFIREYDLVMIDLAFLEEKEMFIRGMKEAYYLFKKMNIIK